MYTMYILSNVQHIMYILAVHYVQTWKIIIRKEENKLEILLGQVNTHRKTLEELL